MKLTIEIESVDGVVSAKLTRGERTWERTIGPGARANLVRLTDAIEARPEYHARVPTGQIESAWRRVLGREGHVSIATLAAESGISIDRASAALRAAMQRGKITRMVDAVGHPIRGHYELPAERP